MRKQAVALSRPTLNQVGYMVGEEDNCFDFLFLIGRQIPAIFEHVLIHAKAQCRVGSYTALKPELFDIMLKLPENEEIAHLSKNMLLYTKVLAPS